MKSIITVLFLFYCSLAIAQPAELLYNPTRLIIKFSESSELFTNIRGIRVEESGDKIEADEIVNNVEVFSFFTQNKIISITPAKLSDWNNPTANEISRIYFLDFLNNDDLEEAINNLNDSPDIELVEYDWRGTGSGYQSMIIPNDPGFNNQWGLRNTGQNINGVTGTPGADINITPAWDLTVGNSNTIVSVLDTGIPLTAAEFSGRILPGYDFANNDNDPTDDQGHGTNVTSIVAASGNNSLGVAGINWNCKIIPIKILNANNSGYYSWWISGITMAVDSGAQVLSMSVGGSSFSQPLLDAVNYALNSGSIVVACMMNENNEVPYYPAGFDNVISVGALNNTDNRAVPFCWGGGSCFGNHIDFVAPGEMIIGLYFLNPTQMTYWCGTSQATPMVTGLISLMLGINPSLNLTQIYNLIKLYAHDQIGNPAEDVPGWDKYYGWGRIDVYQVINSLITDVPYEDMIASSFSLSQNYPNPFNPSTKIKFTIPASLNPSKGENLAQLQVYDILGNEIATLVNEEKSAGTYEITWFAENLPSGVYFYQLKAGSFIETKQMLLLK